MPLLRSWEKSISTGCYQDVAPSRNDSVVFGDRGRLARTGRRPADQTEREDDAPNGSVSPRVEAIGGTPMAATGTVALP